jgi:hypothetical protein
MNGDVKMHGKKLIICAVGAGIALIAAVTAIIIFRNEIIDFFLGLKDAIEDKKFSRRTEFADYADM